MKTRRALGTDEPFEWRILVLAERFTEAMAMKNRLIATVIVVVGLLIVSVPLFAHHGNAEFNTEKTVTVKGTVTEWFWANPHCFLKFDEKTDSGEVRHWVVETSNPPDMINSGWSKYSLKAGDEVAVTMHQVKDASKSIGRVVKVTMANGKVLGTGGRGEDAGAANSNR
jgi:hypothetical protein